MKASEIIEGEVVTSSSPTALTPALTSPLDLPTAHFQAGLQRRQDNRQALIQWIRAALVDGIDFGSIPTKRGPSKPSLWKPGAEKITGMLGVMVAYPSLKDTEQAILNGLTLEHLMVRCELKDAAGRVLAEGIGARSLKQDYGDLNKCLKMAEKSAHIDAVLRLAGLSEVFTQDLEDLKAGGEEVPKPDDASSSPGRQISALECQRLNKRITQLNLPATRVQNWVRRKWQINDYHALNAEQFAVLWQNLETWAQDASTATPAQRQA